MGYGIKIFVPRPLHYVTRSPGGESEDSSQESWWNLMYAAEIFVFSACLLHTDHTLHSSSHLTQSNSWKMTEHFFWKRLSFLHHRVVCGAIWGRLGPGSGEKSPSGVLCFMAFERIWNQSCPKRMHFYSFYPETRISIHFIVYYSYLEMQDHRRRNTKQKWRQFPLRGIHSQWGFSRD